MKYFLCLVGNFQDGGEEQIIGDCLKRNVYQYHKVTYQKGAWKEISQGDTLILVYKKTVVAYGISLGGIENKNGYDEDWCAVEVQNWIKAKGNSVGLPYGVYWNTLQGNKQSVVKLIEPDWAKGLILQLILSNLETTLPQEPVIPLHIETIYSLYQKGFIQIPPIQRGKVWNATRTEILWDSLMRGIPIGSIVIRAACGTEGGGTNFHWDLLDGQQRTNAIALGYQDFTQDEKTSILWYDLAATADNSVKNAGEEQACSRKYFFRVTTPAQPWGYKISTNETQNTTLATWEKREAVNALEEKGKWHRKNAGDRPKPSELWPVDAAFPVPFSLIRKFHESEEEDDFSAFWEKCRKDFPGENWFVFHDEKLMQNPELKTILEENWKKLNNKENGPLSRLYSTVVVAQNSSWIDDSDVGLYFKRMNKAGVEPGNEEIRYSLLKAKVPELKKLDEMSSEIPPAYLADIAMHFWLTVKKDKRNWTSSLSFKNLNVLIKDEVFHSFILNTGSGLQADLDWITQHIVFDDLQNECGLPRVIYSFIARSFPNVVRLLLYFAEEWNFIPPKQLTALISLISILGNDNMVSSGYEIYKTADVRDSDSWLKCTRQWLFDASKSGVIPPIPSPDVFSKICDATSKQDLKEVTNAWNEPSFGDVIQRIWYWDNNKRPGRQLVLYACRKYLQKAFPDYNPADIVWHEENRPWDYDHIFPQDWKIRSRTSLYQELVNEFLLSIGNSAPIPFSKNRGKNASPPGKYLEEDNKLVFVNYQEDFFDKCHKEEWKNNKETAFAFAQITSKRFFDLYSEWYNTLAIHELLDFSFVQDSRKELYLGIKNFFQTKHPEIQIEIYYVISNGQQAKLDESSPYDWSRKSLAIGVRGKYLEKECFICICNGGGTWESGYRRLPEECNIDGNPKQWWHGDYQRFESNPKQEQLIQRLEELIFPNTLEDKT